MKLFLGLIAAGVLLFFPPEGEIAAIGILFYLFTGSSYKSSS